MRRASLIVAMMMTLASRSSAACVGDCNGNRAVTVDELIRGVNIALGNGSVAQCPSFDVSDDGAVAINELIAAVNSALIGCTVAASGDYAGTLTFGPRVGSLTLSVDASGHAEGALMVQASAALTADASQSVTFPAGNVTVTLVGTVDTADGTFEISGTFEDGNGQSTQLSIDGTLPSAAGAVPITARVGGDTFDGTLSRGGSTPTPTATASPVGPTSTPAGPTPTPVASCGDGTFSVTLSNVSADSNVTRDPLELANGAAVDAGASPYVWAITGKPCSQGFGEVVRAFSINVSDAPTRIVPGTYAIPLLTPPFIRVEYKETKFVLGNPSQSFTHQWLSTGGTLEITDAGAGAIRVHASGVTMDVGPAIPGAVGTFTLDISGALAKVAHN